MRFTVAAESLRHVRPFASTDASRPILNAICLESTGVIVATNGHRLLAIAPVGEYEGAPPVDVLVRLPKAVPTWAEHAAIDVPDDATDGAMGTVTYLNNRGKQDVHPCVYVEGPYPTWRNVLPRVASRSNVLPPINGEYVGDFAACASKGNIFFAPDANMSRAIRVEMAGRPNYVGVLMPLVATLWDEITPLPALVDSRPEGAK
jgi:hypothetical protein